MEEMKRMKGADDDEPVEFSTARRVDPLLEGRDPTIETVCVCGERARDVQCRQFRVPVLLLQDGGHGVRLGFRTILHAHGTHTRVYK